VTITRSLDVEQALWKLNDAELAHAPKRLHLAGDPTLLKCAPCVSVVGSRRATVQGIDRACGIASALAARGVIVVSGLAEGIDTAAHVAAMDAGGRTIAVLGTPLDVCYPASNRALLARIVEAHLAISQFESGARPGPKGFPLRNRTMALISDVTIVVEAKDDSGSLHQAWEALRLGRRLFLAASLFEDRSLTFPRELAHYGAEALTRDAFAALFEQLPVIPRDEPAEIPF